MDKSAVIDFLKEYEEFNPVMIKRELTVDPELRFIVSVTGPRRAERPTFSFQKEALIRCMPTLKTRGS